jgi:HlyD family secretion protein
MALALMQTGARRSEQQSGWLEWDPATQVERRYEPPALPLGRRKRRRWPWVTVGAMLVVAAAAFSWRSIDHGPKWKFETVQIERGSLQARVTATGTLSAVTTVQVGSQVSGRVHEIFVDFNSPVKKGQVLATLDPQLLQAAVDQAQASFVGARGGLAKARVESVHAVRELRRAQSLWRERLIARAELDTAAANAGAARGQLEAVRGQLAQAAAALRQAQVNLGYTKIISPIDGVVISRSVDVGQTVAASLQAPTLFAIAEDLRKMQVDTSVAEADVGKLRSAMKAHFKVDAFPGEKFKGRVRQIRSAAQVVQNVVTYDAVIDVDNSDLRLKPGMTANVTFVYAEKAAALKIPTAALRFRPPPDLSASVPKPLVSDGERLIWVMRGGQPVPRKVRTGIAEAAITEVVEGDVQPGDVVITEVAGGEPKPSGGQGRKDKDVAKLKVF